MRKDLKFLGRKGRGKEEWGERKKWKRDGDRDREAQKDMGKERKLIFRKRKKMKMREKKRH